MECTNMFWRGNADLAGAGLHVLEILLADLLALLGNVDRAAIVEALRCARR